MAQITIRAGGAYMVTSPERRTSLLLLETMLGEGGIDVDVEITDYVPGRRGLPPPWTPEEVAIYIGSAAGSGLIGAITTDVYNRAKRWALGRFESKKLAARAAGDDKGRVKGERFLIYSPDGSVLKTWTVDEDGEHETDDD